MTLRRRFTFSLVAVLLAPALGQGQEVDFKMISSGSNRPGLAIWQAPMRDILVQLHLGAAPARLAQQVGLTDDALRATLDSMRSEGVITLVDGVPRPTCMIVPASEGASIEATAVSTAREALPFMRRALDGIKGRYRDIRAFRDMPFDAVSFFLASDVLLDNWQINAVERQWLGADRPLRGKSRYYCALLGRSEPGREPFGIFGNQMTGLSGGRLMAVYGSRRGSPDDLTALPRAELAQLVGLPDSTTRPAILGSMVEQLQLIDEATPRFRETLVRLGLLQGGRPAYAVLDSADDRALDAMAASVTDSLVAVLRRATPALRTSWAASTWGKEVTFEEYGIWWYHFFYTALTRQLAREGAIHLPPSELFHYVYVRERRE